MMKNILVLAVATLATTPVVSARELAAPLVIKLSGEGRWDVECRWVDGDGERKSVSRSSRGRGSKSLVMKNYAGGDCDVKTESGANLTLRADTMGRSQFCPFSMAGAVCGIRIGEGVTTRVALIKPDA